MSPRRYFTDTLIGTPQSPIRAGKAVEKTDLAKAYNTAQEYWIMRAYTTSTTSTHPPLHPAHPKTALRRNFMALQLLRVHISGVERYSME